MAIKSKTQPDIAALIAQAVAQALGQAQAAPQAKQDTAKGDGSWHLDILAQDGSAALVMATTPKGQQYKALASITPTGYTKLGPKVDAVLAKAYIKLLGSIQ